MPKIFIAWDFANPELKTTIQSLLRHPPTGITFIAPGITPAASGEILRTIVVPGIVDADRVLVLLDTPNANVAFEAGLAYGLGRQLALVVQSAERPSWVRDPPFANCLVTPVRGAEDLRNTLVLDGLWHPPNKARPTADPLQDRTLFLCPTSDADGQACVQEQRICRPGWRNVPSTQFNLLDLPEVTAGVTQLVWTVTANGNAARERDGAVNAQNAVIAGWFTAQTLNAMGGRLDAKGMKYMRERFCVLRSSIARAVVDVGPFEHTFEGPNDYADRLQDIPSAPAPRVEPVSTQDLVCEVRRRLLELFHFSLPTNDVPDVARTLGGDALKAEVVRAADKTARIDVLLDEICQMQHLRSGVLERVRKALGGSVEIDELVALVEDPSSERNELLGTAAAPLFTNPNASVADVLGTAIRLDRTTQWGQVLEQCRSDQHSLFLLRGESRQSLGLFLDRLRRFLSDSTQRHRVFNVPFQVEGVFAQSGAEWEQRLAWALGANQPGTAAHHLARESLDVQTFLIMGLKPLHDLTPEQQAGLQEFLEVHYPKCLAQAAPSKPTHLLLAVDYEHGDESFADAVDKWALSAEEQHTELVKTASSTSRARGGPRLLHYVQLPVVQFPTWDEVATYLNNCRPRPTSDVRLRIQQEFDQLVQRPGATFIDLANQLERRIGPI